MPADTLFPFPHRSSASLVISGVGCYKFLPSPLLPPRFPGILNFVIHPPILQGAQLMC